MMESWPVGDRSEEKMEKLYEVKGKKPDASQQYACRKAGHFYPVILDAKIKNEWDNLDLLCS
jgi:hypothetical protein